MAKRASALSSPNDGGQDVFVHISAVERAGLGGLAEGQKVNFEVKTDKMRGKTSAENCRWPKPVAPFHGCTETAIAARSIAGLGGFCLLLEIG